jgi:peptidyl-prolyl cis-trans isomerase A (cyclophilin A)
MRLLLLLVLPLVACTPRLGGSGDDDDSTANDDDAADGNAQVLLTTSMGEFTVELYEDTAPITAGNFLQYVDDGFFDGDDDEGATVFHRVIADFMVQGGGTTEAGAQKETRAPIVNEASDSGLSNLRGTLSMARTDNPDSASSQFFVNVVDNTFLNPGESTVPGYAVFGEVIDGMDVVDDISVVSTGAADVPVTPIVLEDVERI